MKHSLTHPRTPAETFEAGQPPRAGRQGVLENEVPVRIELHLRDAHGHIHHPDRVEPLTTVDTVFAQSQQRAEFGTRWAQNNSMWLIAPDKIECGLTILDIQQVPSLACDFID